MARRSETVEYRYGGAKGRRRRAYVAHDLVAVRTHHRAEVGALGLGPEEHDALRPLEPVLEVPHAGVQVLRPKSRRGAADRCERARSLLARRHDVRFAGRALADPVSRAPVVYTENLFVKFGDDVSPSACRAVLARHGLAPKREVEYARNGWFVAAPEGAGLRVFATASALLEEPAVEFAHPEMIRRAKHRGAFPGQWHLKRTTIGGQVVDQHVHAEAAWAVADGTGATIAVIDDAVDLDHEEFTSAGKVVAPRDATLKSSDPRGVLGDRHGTACAGVACADGAHGASGVAPRARLLPVRLVSMLGSQDVADAIHWAASNGADVISCSWGPDMGDFTDPDDPRRKHVEPLPDSTRLAIDWAVEHGRGGKGCVIAWAAGNGNQPVENDGYASYEKVIAVAACDDTGKQAPYSAFGDAIWCCFPSDHFYSSITPGIWTTDRAPPDGYNPGNPALGDGAGKYTNRFKGTSSSCPGAAGVAALVISRNPALTGAEVRDVLRRCCDRIDEPGGGYDASGHSPMYGYGRLNAKRAVDLAAPGSPAPGPH